MSVRERAVERTSGLLAAKSSDDFLAMAVHELRGPATALVGSAETSRLLVLGLSMARSLARAMGGDLVYRRLTVGSSFVLTLPHAVISLG